MKEQSHAELEQYHYQALRNPIYQLEGMMDVIQEELMMNMPYPKEVSEYPERVQSEWTPRQWDKVQQLQNEVEGWREKHSNTLLEIDRLKAKVDHSNKDRYHTYT